MEDALPEENAVGKGTGRQAQVKARRPAEAGALEGLQPHPGNLKADGAGVLRAQLSGPRDFLILNLTLENGSSCSYEVPPQAGAAGKPEGG